MAVGGESNVGKALSGLPDSAEFEIGGVDFVDGSVFRGEGEDLLFGGMSQDFTGSAIDWDVPSYGKGGKIDCGDGFSFLVGYEGVAGEAGNLCFGAAFEAGGG